MGLKCGIVGLPNVGKSSLFNALTDSHIAAANYPFCTIEPNSGIVPVPDRRLEKVSSIVSSDRTVPATIEFTDIAGLVTGASSGQGLGNKFLAHIRETNAIVHVVRCFENENVTHVAGKVDPLHDVEVVETELALSDLEICTRALEKSERNTKSGDKNLLARVEILRYLTSVLGEGSMLRSLNLDDGVLLLSEELGLITSKPVLFVANVGEGDLESNKYCESLLDYADSSNAKYLPVCASLEAEIVSLLPEERKDYLADSGISEPSLNRLVRAGYNLLYLHSFFTAGPKDSRAWTIPIGTDAPSAAGEIHGDFEKGFIRAEVVAYEDFVRYGGESGAKESGKLRSEGKDYVVNDGDIIHFRFNV